MFYILIRDVSKNGKSSAFSMCRPCFALSLETSVSDSRWFQSGSWYGSGSSILSQCESQWQKIWKKHSKKIIFFIFFQIAIYVNLDFHKERLSYRRSLQPSKENIQQFKILNFFPFFYFWVKFLPSWIRIRIQPTKASADPDPKHCWKLPYTLHWSSCLLIFTAH
jgi:hypothetical protein